MIMLRRIFLITTLILVASCGLRPLNSHNDSGSSASILDQIYVVESDSRFHQLVRQRFLERSKPNASEISALYRLEFSISESANTVLASKSGFNRRESLDVHLDFTLYKVTNNTIFLRGKSFVIIPFDRGSSEFGNLRALENAQVRAATQLADDLRLRILSKIEID